MDATRFSPLGDVAFVEKTAHGIVLGVGEEKFRADVIQPGLMRLKISQAGRFDESPTFATCFRTVEPPTFDVAEDLDSVTVQTEVMRLLVFKRPFGVSAYRKDGSIIFEDHRDDSGFHGYRQLNDSFIVKRRIGAHDSIYGLGEKTGRFDRRGRKFILWNTDVLAPGVLPRNRLYEAYTTLHGQSTRFDPYYSSVPFFYHCRANGDGAKMAGFFVDNGYKGNFDFEEHDVYSYQFTGGQYTEYVFAGPSMRNILGAFTFVTGRMRAPPIWALGQHQCRYHDYTDTEILRIGEEYR
jgi:alpha-glucosidase